MAWRKNAIYGLSESADTITEWEGLVSVGYAVTYIFGTIGAAIYCSNIAPRLLGIHDLRAAAKEDEEKLGFKEEQPDTASAYGRIERRVFELPEIRGWLHCVQT